MRTLALLFALTLSCLAQPLSPHDPAFLQSTSPLRRGLVGYWRLEEASGTRYDCSPTGTHLTSNNNVGQASGISYQSATFVYASSQWLSAANTNLLQFTLATPLTFSAWIKFTNIVNDTAVIAGKAHVAANNRGYVFYMFARVLTFQLTSSAGVTRYLSGTTLLDDSTWKNVLVTYDGSGTTNGIVLYVNGTPETISAGSSSGVMSDIDNAGTFLVGQYASASYVNGAIDELGIWTRMLTAAEIAQLYNSGRATHFPWAHP